LLDAEVQHDAVVVERTSRADVDRGADTAGGDVCATRLVNLDRADGFSREVGEVERTGVAARAAGDVVAAAKRVGRRHLTAVQSHHVVLRTEAAGRDSRTFAVATVDRNAGDALERFRQVRVRELTNVFCVDRIDDTDSFALRVHRRLQGSAKTSDYHFFELFTRSLLVLGERRIDEYCATYDGEQHLRRKPNVWVEFHKQSSPPHSLSSCEPGNSRDRIETRN